MPFLSEDTVRNMGFKFIGKNVKISDKASIYNAQNISINDNSRIDDFCILSAGAGGIKVGKYVHIAAYCSLIGRNLIELEDFAGLSSRVSIYSSSDDYSGKWLTNPCVPEKYCNVLHGDVFLGKHVIIGVGSCVLPEVRIENGTAIGAFSLVNKNLPKSVIAGGVPAAILKERSKNVFDLETQLLSE